MVGRLLRQAARLFSEEARTMSTNDTRPNKGTDEAALPSNWTETDTAEIARFERDDGAVCRVLTKIPIRPEGATDAIRPNLTEDIQVLYHKEQLPSPSCEIGTYGTEQAGRDAALAFIRGRCPEHQRQLVTDAVGVPHCPECTGANE